MFHQLIIPLVFLFILTVVAPVLRLIAKGRPTFRGSVVPSFQVETKPYFFSMAENNFYGMLIAACRNLDLVVFPKVGLNDIFKDKQGADRKQYFRYAQMHVDFLLVTAKDYRPIAGIELDGTSHQNEKQKGRDDKKNLVFKAAGLPLMRFYNQTPYSADSIQAKLEDVLSVARMSG